MSGIIQFNQAEIAALQKFAAQQVENAELELLNAGLNDRIASHENALLYQVIDQLHAAQVTQFQVMQQQAKVNAKVQHGKTLKGHILTFFQGGQQ